MVRFNPLPKFPVSPATSSGGIWVFSSGKYSTFSETWGYENWTSFWSFIRKVLNYLNTSPCVSLRKYRYRLCSLSSSILSKSTTLFDAAPSASITYMLYSEISVRFPVIRSSKYPPLVSFCEYASECYRLCSFCGACGFNHLQGSVLYLNYEEFAFTFRFASKYSSQPYVQTLTTY